MAYLILQVPIQLELVSNPPSEVGPLLAALHLSRGSHESPVEPLRFGRQNELRGRRVSGWPSWEFSKGGIKGVAVKGEEGEEEERCYSRI